MKNKYKPLASIQLHYLWLLLDPSSIDHIFSFDYVLK